MKYRIVLIASITFAVLICGFTLYAPPAVSSLLSEKSAAAGDSSEAVQTAEEIYTATFLINGEFYASVPAEFGSDIVLPTTPAKEGYTFSGWTEIPDTMPAEDITINGSFSINCYDVIYVVDGAEVSRTTYEYNAPVTFIEEPTKMGYTFSGWSEVPAVMPAGDITITGSFSINSYDVIYKVDGEEVDRATYEYNAPVTAKEEPAKTGYTFSGWSEVPAVMPAGDITITGSFSINSYDVIYKVDGEEVDRVTYDYNAPVTSIEEPAKTGYTFSGWSEVPAVMPAEDITITGRFSINSYYLIYKVDGEEVDRVTYEYNAPVTAIEEPVKAGYTFSGWTEVPAVMPAEDITITGSFSINSYYLIYKVDGEEVNRVTYEYNTPVTAKAEPVKTGFIFSGWSSIPETMPACNVEVTGTFSVKPKKLISIQITTPPYKDSQPIQGLFFDPKGMVITAFYDDGSKVNVEVTNALINSGTVKVTPSIFNNTGSQTVTAQYLGMSDAVTVSVAARSAASISISKYPSKIAYIIGDALDLSGGEICINYNNFTRSFLTMKALSVTASGYNPVKTGTQTITVTYTDAKGNTFSTSFTIAVTSLGVPGSVKAASCSYNSNKLNWSGVTGASGYVVYRSTALVGTYSNIAMVKTTTFTDISLTPNKSYFYKIAAYRIIAGKNYYGEPSIVVYAKPVPSAPASPKAVSASYNSIKISWSTVAGANGYVIYRSNTAAGIYTKLTTLKTASYTDKALTTGKTYYYYIKAYRSVSGVNVYGNPSASVSAKPVPAVPSSLTAVKTGKTGIKLNWGASSGAQGYEIYRKDSSSGTFKLIKSTASLSFSNTGLKTNNTYYYEVRAYRTVSSVKIYSPFTPIKTAKPC